MRKVYFTLAELQSIVYQAVPGALELSWVNEALRELYHNGAPDPNPRNEGRRMILPSQWREFARMVSRRIGQPLNA